MENAAQKYIVTDEALAVYDPFRAKLAELKEINKRTVFNYDDPQGNKDARSYVYKLRQSKSAIENARKEEKAGALEYGRKVDAEAKELIGQIEEMIAVHQKPLDEIEAKEKARIEGIKSNLTNMEALMNCAGYSSEVIGNMIARLEETQIDDSYGEFKDEALAVKERSLTVMRAEIEHSKRREKDAAELEALRKEKEERDRKDREEALRQEGEHRASREAEEKARREEEERQAKAAAEKAAQEQKERELIEAREKAEREKAEAEERAKQAAEQERQRIEAEQEAKRKEEERRRQDEELRSKVHHDICRSIEFLGLTPGTANDILKAILDGNIPHVKIVY